MIDESEGGVSGAGAQTAAAIGIAMDEAARGASAAAEARGYLKKQSRLADLQIENVRLRNENLQKLDEYETSHLRWRRFNDQMKGAMQIMVVAIGLLAVIGLAAAIWSASKADGIVVESFTVPAGFAANGTAGDTIADDLTNKIASIRDIASGNSFARSKDVHNDRDEDIKVEIPETGVSLAQAWRYLKGWLGHERPLRGNLRNTVGGKIALTVALAGAGAATFSGQAADLDKLEQQAAEHVFATVDPSNYVLYLDAQGRSAEAYATIAALAQSSPDPALRAAYLSLWSAMTRGVLGDVPLSIARARYSLTVDPRMVISHREIMVGAQLLGEEELALTESQKLLTAREADLPPAVHGNGFVELMGAAALERDMATGDFRSARDDLCFYCSAADALLQRAEYAARLHDIVRSRADITTALAIGDISPATLARADVFADEAAGNWRTAVGDAKAYGDAIIGAAVGPHHNTYPARYAKLKAGTFAAPLRAEALARAGEIAAAQSTISGTPRDCYHCVRIRGVVAAFQGKWSNAAMWFGMAAEQAPSLPFAWLDWGRMLMAEGDLDGALAKFESANKNGPHFADPLEMWGEALMQKNRSDLALAKFEEANRYAPNWGRLHLKWGEALMYTGNKGEAKSQFAIASRFDLSTADRQSLSKQLGRAE